MSRLGAITTDVEDVLAEIAGLQRPAQQAREVIRRTLAATVEAERDPATRREAMVRHDHLDRADRALREALSASARSVATGRRWLARHAATGAAGGGGAAAFGTLPAQLALAGGGTCAMSSGGVLAPLRALAVRLGHRRFDGYVLGAASAVVVGAFSSSLSANATALVAAVLACTTPPVVGFVAAAGVAFLARQAIKMGASRLARVKDSGSYGSLPVELVRLFTPAGSPWTASEWRAVAVDALVPAALAGALVVAGAPLVVVATVGALASGTAWGYRAKTHAVQHRRPDLDR